MSYCKKDGFKKNPVNQVKHNKIVFLFLKKVLRLLLNVVCFPPLKGNLKLKFKKSDIQACQQFG